MGLPYFGVHTFLGESAQGLGPGVRLGGIFGFRLTGAFSLNGELGFDWLNLDAPADSGGPTFAPSSDFSASYTDIALSPLYHVNGTETELVLGPKVGLTRGAASLSAGDRIVSSASSSGYGFGGNFGAFLHASDDFSFGLLVSFLVRTQDDACWARYGATPGDRLGECRDTSQADSYKVFSVTLAALSR